MCCPLLLQNPWGLGLQGSSLGAVLRHPARQPGQTLHLPTASTLKTACAPSLPERSSRHSAHFSALLRRLAGLHVSGPPTSFWGCSQNDHLQIRSDWEGLLSILAHLPAPCKTGAQTGPSLKVTVGIHVLTDGSLVHTHHRLEAGTPQTPTAARGWVKSS